MVTCFGLLSSVNGQAPSPFQCVGSDGFGYYSSSASSSQVGDLLTFSSSRISKITTSTGNRVTLCNAASIGIALNGLAFNSHDNFLYAVSRYDASHFSGKIYRIGENCQSIEIPVTGNIVKFTTNNINTIDAAGGNISSATFDLDNNYYVNTSFTKAASTGFTNKLQKIEIVNNTAVVKSQVTLTCSSCNATTRLRITDIIFDESSGMLLGSNKETNKLYSINSNTGAITEIGLTSITASILGIYKNRDGNVRAVTETGNIYSVNVSTGVFTFLIAASALNSGNADGASGCYAPPKITGRLFIDANGLSDNIVNGIGTNKAGSTPMYANLVKDGVIVKSDVLDSLGFYKFLGLFTGSYEVQISSIKGEIGLIPPSQDLPVEYSFVGDNVGVGAGNDGTTNGKQSLTIASGQDILDVNFGIDGIPITTGFTQASQENPSNQIQVIVDELSFSDPEEPSISNITIQDIPDPSFQGILYYNGIAVTAGQNIPNYNSSSLTVDPVEGEVTVTFTFFSTDMAGLVSNVSTINIPFTSTAVPVVISSFRGEFESNVNVLEWITLSEFNTDYFAIEKSDASGGFVEIGKIHSYGNSLEKVVYNYYDNIVTPISYYRLRIVDIDGKYEFSNVISVKAQRHMDIEYYPSLVNDILKVKIRTENGVNSYLLVNLNGEIMAKGILDQGINSIELTHLHSGLYSLMIYSNKELVRIGRIVKM